MSMLLLVDYNVNAFDYVHNGVRGLLVDNKYFVNLEECEILFNPSYNKTFWTVDIDYEIGTITTSIPNSSDYSGINICDTSCVDNLKQTFIDSIYGYTILRSYDLDSSYFGAFINNVPFGYYQIVDKQEFPQISDETGLVVLIERLFSVRFYGFFFKVIKIDCCHNFLNFKPIIKILGG